MVMCVNAWSCSRADAKRIKKIIKIINKGNEGLSFNTQLDDIKLHIAYVLSQKKSCHWSDEYQKWYESEFQRISQYAISRIDRGQEIQHQIRKKFILKDEDKEILKESFYAGINLKLKNIDIGHTELENWQEHKKLLEEKINFEDFDRINYKSPILYLRKYSIVAGHYTQDMKENGKTGLRFVKDSFPTDPELDQNDQHTTHNVEPLPPIEQYFTTSTPAISKQVQEIESSMQRVKQAEIKKKLEHEKKIQAVVQKSGLPLDVIVKYKEVFIILDVSVSIKDDWEEIYNFAKSLESLLNRLKIKINYRLIDTAKYVGTYLDIDTIENLPSNYDLMSFFTNQLKTNVNSNNEAGIINGTLGKTFTKDMIIVFIGDGQLVTPAIETANEVNHRKKIKQTIIFKPFGDYNKKFFNRVAQPLSKGDIVLSPGLKELTDQEIDFLTKNLRKNLF